MELNHRIASGSSARTNTDSPASQGHKQVLLVAAWAGTPLDSRRRGGLRLEPGRRTGSGSTVESKASGLLQGHRQGWLLPDPLEDGTGAKFQLSRAVLYPLGDRATFSL